jgi:Mg-chelatase subunit ChlD
MKEEESKRNIKKIKNILSDETSKGNNDFDILFLVDATGSMSQYIIAAKEETKNISAQLRKLYPEKMFKYGYIFYRDPIDSKSDKHEVIDLTDDVNSFPEKIGKISATGGGDAPEDWAGAYKLANEKISWRNGTKVIMHLTDAGAHGKLFTSNDKYPEEESKLIVELEKCAQKGIKIFGYTITDECQQSFNECSRIYRSKGGSYEIVKFFTIPQPEQPKTTTMDDEPEYMCMGGMMMMPRGGNMMMNNMNMMSMNGMMPMGGNMMMNNMNMMSMNRMMPMNNMMNMSAPMGMNSQMNVNMNFKMNAINSIQSILDK